jgi:hypothetical protein
MWVEVDEMVRILEAGVNIVSTAAFITGHSLGEGRQRIIDACERGGTTVFGSGINLGFADLMAIASAGICDRVDKITITEAADIAGYDSPETELPVGFARPIDDPDLLTMTAAGTAVFQDVVHLLGQALGVEFDEVVCEATYHAATEHVDLGSWEIGVGCVGCVAGIAASWHGKVAGRSIVELRIRWRKTLDLDPPLEIVPGYHTEIDGRPTIHTKVDLLPPPDFEATTFGEFMVLGMIATAMPAIDAIPHVVKADPGIITYADGLLPLPKGLVRL